MLIAFAQNFIDNICTSSTKYLIISWAIEGQGGDGHVNCRNNDYVINEISKRNFHYDEKLTHFLQIPWTGLGLYGGFRGKIMGFKNPVGL
jgi:tryptophanyl-tRNA synthetase